MYRIKRLVESFLKIQQVRLREVSLQKTKQNKNSLLSPPFSSNHSLLCKSVIFFYDKLYNVLSKELSWAFFSTENWPIRDKPSVLDEYLEINFKNSYVQKVFFFFVRIALFWKAIILDTFFKQTRQKAI